MTSPAFVAAEDAANIKIPFCALMSKDEDVEEVKKFELALKEPHHVETFEDQIHGFMSARSDLENEKVKQEYERGYQIVVDFFAKYLGTGGTNKERL
jgi:dienelactone hydrolase